MAVRFQLPTGKTVLLTDKQYFDLLDDEDAIQKLVSEDAGIYLDDPFMDIKVKEFKQLEIPDIEIEDIPDTEIENIKKEIDGS